MPHLLPGSPLLQAPPPVVIQGSFPSEGRLSPSRRLFDSQHTPLNVMESGRSPTLYHLPPVGFPCSPPFSPKHTPRLFFPLFWPYVPLKCIPLLTGTFLVDLRNCPFVSQQQEPTLVRDPWGLYPTPEGTPRGFVRVEFFARMFSTICLCATTELTKPPGYGTCSVFSSPEPPPVLLT